MVRCQWSIFIGEITGQDLLGDLKITTNREPKDNPNRPVCNSLWVFIPTGTPLETPFAHLCAFLRGLCGLNERLTTKGAKNSRSRAKEAEPYPKPHQHQKAATVHSTLTSLQCRFQFSTVSFHWCVVNSAVFCSQKFLYQSVPGGITTDYESLTN